MTQTIMFNLYPCEKPRRYSVRAENITTGKGGVLATDLTRSKAEAVYCAAQNGAILAGAKVSGQRRY